MTPGQTVPIFHDMTGPDLKARREKAGMTRTELGAAIGRTERSIYRYENGERPIDGPTAIAIESILGPVTTRSHSIPRRSAKLSK